jgi:hypothetical protein
MEDAVENLLYLSPIQEVVAQMTPELLKKLLKIIKDLSFNNINGYTPLIQDYGLKMAPQCRAISLKENI